MTTNRENLERMCYTMKDEISELTNKSDTQGMELKDIQGALRLQNKMFDQQNLKMVSEEFSGFKILKIAPLFSRLLKWEAFC